MNNFIRTSDPAFAPGTFPLPTPEALSLVRRTGSVPAKPGLYEFGHSFVAEDGRYTAMGPTCLVQLKENSNYGVRFLHDQQTRAVGIILWCRRVDGTPGVDAHPMDYEWRPAGAQQDCNNAQSTPRPQLPMAGWTNHLLQAHEVQRCTRLTSGQGWNTYDEYPRSPEPAPQYCPTILPYHMPSAVMDVRIRYVGFNSATSLPSPTLTVPVESFGAGPFHSPFEVCKRERPLQGVKGYYIEARRTGTEQWYRQKNPAQTGYLWDFAQTHFEIKNFAEDFAVIEPVDESPGEVYLCSLQRCLNESTKSVIVDVDQETYSPIFNGVDNGQGTATLRTIQGEQGLPWKITTKNNAGDPNTDWPVFVEGSIGTIINGIQIDSSTATVGIDFCAYNDSAAFRPRISNYSIALRGSGYRCGIRQVIEARAPVPPGQTVWNKDQHTCSEPIFSNGFIGCRHPIVVEGGQSANWVFHNSHIDGSGDCDSVIASINNNGQVRFTGQTLAEQGRALFAILTGRLIEIENLFSDRGFPCYVNASSRCYPIIRINCAVPNQHSTWTHLVEAPCGGLGSVEFEMTGRMDAGDCDAVFYASRYAGVRYRLDPHIRFQGVIRRQPTLAQWQTELADFAAVRSYFVVWDNSQDIAEEMPTAIAYGLHA